MSLLNYVIEKLKLGKITFINAVTLANRDLPYHDTVVITSQSTSDNYVIGQNQIDAHGNQSKRFVSKSTLIYSSAYTTIKFNDSKNVDIVLLPAVWYEFKSNIWQIFYPLPTGEDYILIYFEGVLPSETRAPE